MVELTPRTPNSQPSYPLLTLRHTASIPQDRLFSDLSSPNQFSSPTVDDKIYSRITSDFTQPTS